MLKETYSPKKVESRLEADTIVSEKLSIVLNGIKTLLKPYQNSLLTSIEEVNGSTKQITITATIKV